MPIGVRIYEYTGEIVGEYGGRDIHQLCRIAEADTTRYPLLSGIDPYDDTTFNPRQAQRVGQELREFAETNPSVELRKVAIELAEVVSLLAPEQGRPHHRRLVFSGD